MVVKFSYSYCNFYLVFVLRCCWLGFLTSHFNFKYNIEVDQIKHVNLF